jgi:hypothetical protein
MSDDSLSNLGYSSIISYISFCVIFFTLKFVYFAEDSMSWIILFLVLSFLLQFMNNLSITSNKNICGKSNIQFAMYHTAVPWICVFTVTALCLIAFPGWLRVFSNTFGLYAAQAYGLQSIISELFNDTQKAMATEKATKEGSSPDIQLLKAIDSLYSNPTTVINELDPKTVKKMVVTKDKIDSFNDDLKKKFYDTILVTDGQPPTYALKDLEVGKTRELLEWDSLSKLIPNFVRMPKQQLINDLYRMTLLKDTVGYFFWFMFVGILTSMISINSLISTPCATNKKNAFDIIFNNV